MRHSPFAVIVAVTSLASLRSAIEGSMVWLAYGSQCQARGVGRGGGSPGRIPPAADRETFDRAGSASAPTVGASRRAKSASAVVTTPRTVLAMKRVQRRRFPPPSWPGSESLLWFNTVLRFILL